MSAIARILGYMESWSTPSAFGPCICSQLRRTARKVSALYDQALTETGLTVTQHALLVNVARAGEIGRSALAAKVGMDRTTLTRNLKPLETSGLIEPAESSDRRERLLRLSPAGMRKLKRSYTAWESVQREFALALGKGPLERLRKALAFTEGKAVLTIEIGE